MVNFMCQLVQAMMCPDIWSDDIRGFPEEGWDEMNVYIGRLSKADSPPSSEWASIHQLKV